MQEKLVLNIAPELEDNLVDYLLAFDGLSGFTTMKVSGHGEHADMSVAEQVTGRRKRLQFELILSPVLTDKLIGGLHDNVGPGINYWVQPVSRSGRV